MGWKSYNLVAFGCSYTFGHGLKDCIASDGRSSGPLPSKYAWPTILGKLGSFNSVDNMGIPGASSKRVVKKVLEYDFKDKSVVVILWPNKDRQTIFKGQHDMLHMMPSFIYKDMPKAFWRGKDSNFADQVKMYYENFHEEFNCVFEQKIYINYVHSYLKTKGIKSFHLVPEHEYDKRLPQEDQEYFKSYDLSGLNLALIQWSKHFKIDDALDKPHPHPGPNSHKHLAVNIRRWFFK